MTRQKITRLHIVIDDDPQELRQIDGEAFFVLHGTEVSRVENLHGDNVISIYEQNERVEVLVNIAAFCHRLQWVGEIMGYNCEDANAPDVFLPNPNTNYETTPPPYTMRRMDLLEWVRRQKLDYITRRLNQWPDTYTIREWPEG